MTEQDQFMMAIDQYRTNLIDGYNKKTDLLGSRETLRYQYVTYWRSKFENAATAIRVSLFDLEDPLINEVFRTFIWTLPYNGIPMQTANGGLTKFVAFDSPYNNTYGVVLYGSGISKNLMSPSGELFDLTEANRNRINNSEIRTNIGNYFSGSGPQTYNAFGAIPLNIDGASSTSSFPYADLKSTLIYNWSANYYAQPIEIKDAASQKIIEILNTPSVSGQSFMDVLTEGRDILKSLYLKTISLLELQLQIIDMESQIADFITAYKEQTGYDPGINASNIYTELLNMSRAQSGEDLKSTSSMAPTGSEIVDPNPPVPVVSKPFNWKLVGGVAAALGIFVATKGES